MSAAGAIQFARYAYPPNELGYCGPEGGEAMLLPGAEAEIELRARQFDGAWVYLEFLAAVLGTSDPLAAEVVEAYWIGSPLLDSVPSASLVEVLEERFATQIGGTWRESAGRAQAHHSYQVFEVYPWAAMLTQGLAPGPAVSVLDRCRIRCGVVEAVDGETVTVSSSALAWDGALLTPGAPALETLRWSLGGNSLIAAPAVGEVVSLHWDWVCEVLSADQAARIEEHDERQRTLLGLAQPATGRP
ncbi:DUF6390 family protein [Nocardioides sp.]|uniref:DUF6390 family protein n=1 Tax=Nocardioides sp. TaxID=35761 RepID=UPI003D140FA6